MTSVGRIGDVDKVQTLGPHMLWLAQWLTLTRLCQCIRCHAGHWNQLKLLLITSHPWPWRHWATPPL